MTGLIHTILLRVTIAGVASAVALKLAGEGALREAVRLSAGLLMLLALLQPLAGVGRLDVGRLSGFSWTTTDELEAQNMRTVMSTVAASISESLETRAANEGIDCDVVVTMGSDAEGLLQISHVTVYYRERDAGRLGELRTLLREECGVDEDRQELIMR